jgi:hypothetical protein
MKRRFTNMLGFRLMASCAMVVVAVGAARPASAQGCLLTRSMAPILGAQLSPYLQPGEWQVGANYRQFTADHQYQGEDLSPAVTALGTNVISKMRYLDVTATYALTTQWNVTVAAPFILEATSNRALPSTVAGSPRFTHSSSGLADMTVGVRHWFMNCDVNPHQNFSVGVGVKMPTGHSNATDAFPNAQGLDVRDRPVDQSIQLGDGGWGLAISVEAFRAFSRISTFASGVYVINPKGQNDTLSPPALLNPAGPNAVAEAQRFNTVSDSYLIRAGVGVAVPKVTGLSATMALRMEGVPINDLFGSTQGFRRPGYYTTLEPGAIVAVGRSMLFFNVPVRVHQNVRPSLGFVRDSTFADFMILTGASFLLGPR